MVRIMLFKNNMLNLGLISGILSLGKTVLSGIQNISNNSVDKTNNTIDDSVNLVNRTFHLDKTSSSANTTTNIVLSNNLLTKANLENKIEDLGKTISEFGMKKGMFTSYNLSIGSNENGYFLKDITGRTIGIEKNSEIEKITEQLYKLNKLKELFDQFPGKTIISLASEIDKTRSFSDYEKVYAV